MGESKNSPLVSVIIPAFNNPDYLKESLESVLNQTYKHFEVLIIDDHSIPPLKESLPLDDRRVRYVYNGKNAGTAASRNIGLSQAEGEIIAYCDHDDIWMPGHIEHGLNALLNSGEADMTYGDNVIDFRGKYLFDQIKPDFNKDLLEIHNIIGTPSTVLHRRACTDISGVFDTDRIIKENSSEDWDLWLRISDGFKIVKTDSALTRIRLHGSNLSYSADFTLSGSFVALKRIRKRAASGDLKTYPVFSVIKPYCPLHSDLWDNITAAYLSCGNNPRNEAFMNFCAGLELFVSGEFSSSFDRLRSCLKIAAEELRGIITPIEISSLMSLMARCEIEIGGLDRAEEILDKALRTDPKNQELIELKLLCMYKNKDYAGFDKLSKLADSPLANNLKGIRALNSLNFSYAEELFSKAIAFAADFGPALSNLDTLKKITR